MSEYLQNKVILITGAGNGFGRLIAEKCAAGGARVVGVDVDDQALATVFEAITAAGGQGLGIAADVTDRAALRAAVARAIDAFGAVDVLVNNAGVMPLAYFSDHGAAADKWDRAIDINIKGVINGISAVYDQMIAQGRGQVVNISSIYGNAGIAGSGVYSATKAAVTVLSDSLRIESKGKIKVTTVKPTGVTGTNLASWIVNDTAIYGIVGQRAAEYTEHVTGMVRGTLPEALTDDDSIAYWLISPEELADAVVHVIDQPWGISISDITVRASGEDYLY
ncbi:putative acetoin(diacetyl) reductase [Gordonia hirsuta DSM 44140 = NBRC 16056]|uniref:Putative acetoin(Diacetyl) reductase n=1 Tax=Gordonia hirsuta DSM 44140 = NBRC 16056 TaxID=1121927 RepID=L7LDP7_9ACTN|nr:SDR family oxidoreductase [Gordonia hirsuta]GAC58999.1 putative acetoin(diacetyl) reductase [Gordonia hirsuta DSM 44140 = NBRC 16056]